MGAYEPERRALPRGSETQIVLTIEFPRSDELEATRTRLQAAGYQPVSGYGPALDAGISAGAWGGRRALSVLLPVEAGRRLGEWFHGQGFKATSTAAGGRTVVFLYRP